MQEIPGVNRLNDEDRDTNSSLHTKNLCPSRKRPSHGLLPLTLRGRLLPVKSDGLDNIDTIHPWINWRHPSVSEPESSWMRYVSVIFPAY